MNKQELKQQILKELEPYIDRRIEEEVQDIKQKDGFEINVTYWLINDAGAVTYDSYDGVSVDKWRISQGNAFHTEKEAEKHLEYLNLLAEYKAKIKEFNDGWEPDWNDFTERKYHIYYSYNDQSWQFKYDNYHQSRETYHYAKSDKILTYLANHFGSDKLKIILGIKEGS